MCISVEAAAEGHDLGRETENARKEAAVIGLGAGTENVNIERGAAKETAITRQSPVHHPPGHTGIATERGTGIGSGNTAAVDIKCCPYGKHCLFSLI